MKTFFAYVIVILTAQAGMAFTGSISTLPLWFLRILLHRDAPHSYSKAWEAVEWFAAGTGGSAAAVGGASLVFRLLAGPDSFTLLPFVTVLVPLLVIFRDDKMPFPWNLMTTFGRGLFGEKRKPWTLSLGEQSWLAGRVIGAAIGFLFFVRW